MSIIYENITFDLDKITDEYMRRVNARTDELMDEKLAGIGYVKVVRCRDCRWCMAYSSATYCDRFAHALPTSEPNGFCAWGERK